MRPVDARHRLGDVRRRVGGRVAAARVRPPRRRPGLAAARVLALRVFRSGKDVAVGSLAAEGHRTARGALASGSPRGEGADRPLALVGLAPAGHRRAVRRAGGLAPRVDARAGLPVLALDSARRLRAGRGACRSPTTSRSCTTRDSWRWSLRREVEAEPCGPAFRSRCCSWTSTGSSPSTTRTGTWLAAGRWSRPGSVLRESRARVRHGRALRRRRVRRGAAGDRCRGARYVAERIRERVARHVFLEREGLGVRLTVSIGLASLPTNATTADGLIRAADEAMYWIKQRGKNGIHDAVAGQPGRRGPAIGAHPSVNVRSLFLAVLERSRHRPRHGQHVRLRARQGHRRQRAFHRRHQQGERPDRGRRQGSQGDARPHAGQHRGHQADEGRRHRRLRGHREDAGLLHQEGAQPQRLGAAAHRHRRAVGDHAGREARGEGQRLPGQGLRGAPGRGGHGGGHRRRHADHRALGQHDRGHRRRHHRHRRHLARGHRLQQGGARRGQRDGRGASSSTSRRRTTC